MDFSQEFKTKRLKMGFTQKQLSEKLKIPKRSIENWELGFNKPPSYVQQLLLKELNNINKKSSV